MILILILTSAGFHAIWNVMVRASGDRDAVIFNIALISLLASWIYLLGWEGFGPVTSAGIAWSVGAGLFEVFAFVALAKAYHAGPVGPAYAIARGAAPLMLLPFSMAFMGETPTAGTVGAMAVVAGGVFVLGRRKPAPLPAPLPGAMPPDTTRAAPASTRPLTYYVAAVLAAAFIAAFNGCYKMCSLEKIGPAARYCYALTLTLPFQLLFLRSHPPSSLDADALARSGNEATADAANSPHPHVAFHRIAAAFRRHPVYCILGGVICTGSFLLFLIALDMDGIGVGALTSLRTLSIPVAGLIALAFLREKLGAREWLGIGIITAGIVALSWFSQPGH